MSTCGYICPQCEGKGFLADGSVCDWCSEKNEERKDDKEETEQVTDETWINETHEGKCCSDE